MDIDLMFMVSDMIKWINMDLGEEIKQYRLMVQRTATMKHLEADGYALCNLLIEEVKFNRRLGQYFMELKIPQDNMLPDTCFEETAIGRSGKVVLIYKPTMVTDIAIDGLQPDAIGYITMIRGQTVIVKLARRSTQPNSRFVNILYIVNDLNACRMKRALRNLQSSFCKRPLVGMLIPVTPIDVNPLSLTDARYQIPIRWFNSRLNAGQMEAVTMALQQPYLALIHGPPGTGKTTTLVELILQLVIRDVKVLVCAPSNGAVDNVFKMLLTYQEELFSRYRFCRMIRIGRQNRIDHEIHPYSIFNVSRETEIIMSTLLNSDISGNAMQNIARYVFYNSFDVVIIEECAQAVEPACWIPLQFAKKCILLGDHQQLPATIKSQEAANCGLAISLLERVAKFAPNQTMKMLTTQHRMNRLIMQWSSQNFYDGQLVAADHVADRRLVLNGCTLPVITLIDTAGCEMMESEVSNTSSSIYNDKEAQLVMLVVESLINRGLNQLDLGIISPYKSQVDLIRNLCKHKYKEVEVNTVDGFQGREKEALVMSLVRSNPYGKIGFLNDGRRLNVAVTRARCHLVVVADSSTVSRFNSLLQSFMDHCRKYGMVIKATSMKDVQLALAGKLSSPSPVPSITLSSPPTTVSPVPEPNTNSNYQEEFDLLMKKLQMAFTVRQFEVAPVQPEPPPANISDHDEEFKLISIKMDLLALTG